MEIQSKFGVWDYVVLIIVLMISTGIGIYYRFTGGKQKTVQEYLLADKNMSIIPVAFSLMASFMSAITILGVASENYSYGIQFVVINLSHLVGTPIAVYLYLPVFFKLQLTSTYEYLELRFGKTARLAASICYTLQMCLYMGVVVYAPAIALEALTGINKFAAIITIGMVCTFYSTIGGMKAVLMTDLFQAILMFMGVFSVIGSALAQHGSFSEIWKIAAMGNRTELWNFDPDPTTRHSWFSLMIGGCVIYLSLYAVNQVQIQRYLTVKDLKSAQRALWLNWPILCLLGFATAFSGLAIYSRYYGCDPVKAGYINSMDQLMPYYVVESMGHIPGLPGLFVAGIFSASLSTISASLNSMAAVTMEDYYKPIRRCFVKTELSPKEAGFQSKIIAFMYGGVCLCIAFMVQYLGAILNVSLTIFGAVGGPILGLFTLGMFTFTANEAGSVTGLAAGIAASFWLAFAPKPPPTKLPTSIEDCKFTILNSTSHFTSYHHDTSAYPWIYRISYLYNGVIGLLVTLSVGLFASYVIRLITGRKTEDENYNPNLFTPPLANKILKKKDNRTFILVKKSNYCEDIDD